MQNSSDSVVIKRYNKKESLSHRSVQGIIKINAYKKKSCPCPCIHRTTEITHKQIHTQRFHAETEQLNKQKRSKKIFPMNQR